MAWHRTATKPSSETICTQFTDVYCQASNISHTLVGNIVVDHSDVVGAPPVVVAPTTSSFLT